MPSFAELRARAGNPKHASVNKVQNTRDKYSSRSSKNLDWDPNHKKPPPGPIPIGHARNSSSVDSRAISRENVVSPPPPPQRGPPIIPRATRPDIAVPPTPCKTPPKLSTPGGDETETIDWASLSPEDKQVFFSWLDEFFERLLNIKIPPRMVGDAVEAKRVPIVPSSRPPAIPTWSKPSQAMIPPLPADDAPVMSYPPPSAHGSAALGLAQYFATSTYWDSAWYLSSELPPPMQESPPPAFSAVWEICGNMKSIFGGVLFADLSMCWYSVRFSTANQSASPNDPNAIRRSASYLPPPSPKDRQTLVGASETYGETIAGFAESFEAAGKPCARGDSWDLASEALKYFDQYDYVPKPVPSISRTHGHLIFEGKVSGDGAVQAGRWRGGDNCIRRGDIVEWREARINTSANAWSILGAHTAIVVRESMPALGEGDRMRPVDIGSLEVVEQTSGRPPARKTYDLNQMMEGEIWIYRPIGMEAYIGVLLSPKRPDNIPTCSI